MSRDIHYESGPFPTLEFDEVDSTNAEALRRAASGEGGPVWLLARRQTAGRGRSGRVWNSQTGNLTATLLLRPGCAPDKLQQMAFIAGIAVHAVAVELHGRGSADSVSAPRLKWPNDILAGHAKLGGILIESTTAGSETAVAIGIGLNIVGAPTIEGRQTAALVDWRISLSPSEVLALIDREMRRWLLDWQSGARFDTIRAEWVARAGKIGEPVSINTGTETVVGAYAGIDETGALLVSSVPAKFHEIRRFTFGDVSLSPPREREGKS